MSKSLMILNPFFFFFFIFFFFFFILLLWPAVATSTLPLTKPNCNSTCGDIQVPYPFGLKTDEEYCSYNENFRLSCDESVNPPKLYFGALGVIGPSYEGQLTILSRVGSSCGLTGGVLIYWHQYTVSETENKFITLGCDTTSNISASNGREFQSGCTMFCTNKTDVINGSCTGIGCCQTSIPKGFASFAISVTSNVNHKRVFDFSPCSYAFIVKSSWFNFSSSYLSNFTTPYRTQDGWIAVPVVLDWAIETKSCGEAVENKTSYACRAENSICVTSKNDRGYSCNCTSGYKGNPYLQDGCQDIDECDLQSHNCSTRATCTNSIGNYTCHCPLGYHGDGWKSGTSLYGVIRKGSECQDNLIPVIAGISAGFLVLPILMWFLYWAKMKRERMILFQQNGGKLLMHRLESHKEARVDFKFITINQVKKATENFLEVLPVQGGFGSFFKGTLSDGKSVMVKRYPLNKNQMNDQIIQFVSEVDILSRINHKHVVKLLGCCLDTKIPMLVYEHCSPEENLLLNMQHLSWDDRLRIAAQTADALDYLHSDSVPVFHGKFVSSDILLQEEKKNDGSSELVSKVCDFKAARLAPLYQTLGGESGHKSDELEAIEKCDVYCFGVVLVELLTGEKKDTPVFISNLVKLMEEGTDLSTILDQKIAKDAKEEQLQVVGKLVLECLQDRSEDRPAMNKVKKELEPFLSASNP